MTLPRAFHLRLRIAPRIGLGFGAALLPALVAGGFAVWQIDRIGDTVLQEQAVAANLAGVQRIATEFADLRREVVAMAGTPGKSDQAAQAEVSHIRRDLAEMIPALDSQALRSLAEQALARAEPYSSNIAAIVQARDAMEATKRDRLEPATQVLTRQTSELQELSMQAANPAVANVARRLGAAAILVQQEAGRTVASPNAARTGGAACPEGGPAGCGAGG